MAPEGSTGRSPLAALILAIGFAIAAVTVVAWVPSTLEARARGSLEREATGILGVAATLAAPAIAADDGERLAGTLDGLALGPEIAYILVRRGEDVLAGRRAEAARDLGTASGVGARYDDGLLHVGSAIPGVAPLTSIQIGYRLDALTQSKRVDAMFTLVVAILLLLASVASGLRYRVAATVQAPPAAREESTTKVFAGDEFIGYLSHELRTPLSAILGYTEMLQEDAMFLEQQDFLPDLRQIQRAGAHMLALVDDVVALQRVFAGTLELEVGTFEIAALVQEVQEEVAGLINRTLTTLEVDRASDARQMTADRHKLLRALTNVIREATGATGQGELTLTVRREIEPVGRAWIVFRIRHPDLEVAEHEITAMIRGFGEERTRALPRYHKTGLGLVISREFCRAQGGDLTVFPEGESGTVFELRVPQNVR